MNASVLLAAAALALAAPVGYLTYERADALSAPPATPAAAAASEQPPNLLVRLHHDGAPMAVLVQLSDGRERAVDLGQGDTVLAFAVDPSAETSVSVSGSSRPAFDVLGLFATTFTGSSGATFEACDVVEVLFQTFARDGSSGVKVLGPACVPGVQRHVGVESSGPSVAAPHPACPTRCSFGFGFGGEGGLAFEVPEGATSIDVRASWDAESPFTRTLEVWLLAPDDACGEGCWTAVVTERGAESVAFTYEEPAAGSYAVATFFTTSAGASLRQDVWLEATVHAS